MQASNIKIDNQYAPEDEKEDQNEEEESSIDPFPLKEQTREKEETT